MNQINKEEEKKIRIYRSIIFRLSKEERKEKNWDKRRKINLELKENLEKALEITPNDIGFKIDLMYVYINLKELEKAREIGNTLLGQTDSKGYINALALIEKKSGNYDKAIEYIKRLLEKEPNNQALRKELEMLEYQKENKPISREMIEKRNEYKKIATLERKIRNIENSGKKAEDSKSRKNKFQTLQKQNIGIYQQIGRIAERIVEKYPEEIVAREKLVKALYITGEKEQATQQIETLLHLEEKDEIGLWYLSEIQRDNGDLEGERQTLGQILENAEPGTQIKAAQRLTIVEARIEQRDKRKEMREALQIKYATEEERKKFIEEVQQDFLYGRIGKKDIQAKIEEAKKYVNFDRSLIDLADIEAKITDDKEQKIKRLEDYVDTKDSITSEEYARVQEEISRTRSEMEEDQMMEAYLDQKEEKEKQKRQQSNIEQREYSKDIIAKLNKGEITQDELPEIIKKLEGFMDRARSIFLITKLYEALYSRERAYDELIKYSNISDLSPDEKRQIAQMQKALTEPHKETDTMKRIKGIYKRKEEKEERYHKKIQKEKIKQWLEEGKTVKQIFNLLKDSGTTLKTIISVKGKYSKGNELLESRRKMIEEDAQALLKGGYTPDEVFEIIEYDVPISTLKQMNRTIRKQEMEAKDGIEH